MKLFARFILSAAVLGATAAQAQSFTLNVPVDIKQIPLEFVAIKVNCALNARHPVTAMVATLPDSVKHAESPLNGGNVKTTAIISFDAAQFPDPYKNKPEAITGYACWLIFLDKAGKQYQPFATGSSPGLLKEKPGAPFSVQAKGNF